MSKVEKKGGEAQPKELQILKKTSNQKKKSVDTTEVLKTVDTGKAYHHYFKEDNTGKLKRIIKLK